MSGRLLGHSCSLRLLYVFFKYKYLNVSLVGPTLVLGVGISFLLRLFLIILVPFYKIGQVNILHIEKTRSFKMIILLDVGMRIAQKWHRKFCPETR